MAILVCIVGVVLANVINLIKVLYRNSIAYEITAISGRLRIDDGKLAKPIGHYSDERVGSMLVSISNHGVHNLKDVSLYVSCIDDPYYMKVETSEVSEATVSTSWVDGKIKLDIPTFMRGETLKLAVITKDLVHNYDAVRGAGGPYRVMTKSAYDRAASRKWAIFLGSWFLMAAVSQIANYYDGNVANERAADSRQPPQLAHPKG